MTAEEYNSIRVDLEYAFQQLHPIRNETSKEQDSDRAERAIQSLARIMNVLIDVRDAAMEAREQNMHALRIQPSMN